MASTGPRQDETATANPPESVLIVGGGLAGLAAADALAESGFSTTLIESRRQLGGRATSYSTAEGEVVDNCQHVSMGCCTNLTRFCIRAGIADSFDDAKSLFFQDEQGRVSPLGSALLPAPFHLAPDFLAASFLTWGDKVRIAYGLFRLLRSAQAKGGESFRDWLMRHYQTPRTCERFWGLVLTSALNESIDRTEFRYARQVFVEGFLTSRRGSVVSIPKAPLGELYGDRMHRWLTQRAVDVRLGVAAESLILDGDSVRGCRTRQGQEIYADHVIIAVPFQRLLELLPEELRRRHETFGKIERLEASPITSVHLWFDRDVMERPHLVPVGRTIQWLFRRPTQSPGEGYVQAVVSASRDLSAKGRDEVRRIVETEIRDILPASRQAIVLRALVVTERHATFSVVPGIDEVRPSQKTPVKNLFLAGDYTQTGWPATMEGAVRSGILAADAILGSCGRPLIGLASPLAVSWWVRPILRTE